MSDVHEKRRTEDWILKRALGDPEWAKAYALLEVANQLGAISSSLDQLAVVLATTRDPE